MDQTFGTPGVSYVKWDCNRFVTQPGSTYLPADRQLDLLVDYNFALYDIMKRMADKYPGVMVMECSGGSGRADYGALKYFHSSGPATTRPARPHESSGASAISSPPSPSPRTSPKWATARPNSRRTWP